MALYIDCAFLDDIIQVAKTVPLAGAHDLTMTSPALLEMVIDQQSERAVEQFSQDWQKMKAM
jgi:hypothetical protein